MWCDFFEVAFPTFQPSFFSHLFSFKSDSEEKKFKIQYNRYQYSFISFLKLSFSLCLEQIERWWLGRKIETKKFSYDIFLLQWFHSIQFHQHSLVLVINLKETFIFLSSKLVSKINSCSSIYFILLFKLAIAAIDW